jgi:hypothetical protein
MQVSWTKFGYPISIIRQSNPHDNTFVTHWQQQKTPVYVKYSFQMQESKLNIILIQFDFFRNE